MQFWMMTKQCSSESHKSKVKIGLLGENLISKILESIFSTEHLKESEKRSYPGTSCAEVFLQIHSRDITSLLEEFCKFLGDNFHLYLKEEVKFKTLKYNAKKAN